MPALPSKPFPAKLPPSTGVIAPKAFQKNIVLAAVQAPKGLGLFTTVQPVKPDSKDPLVISSEEDVQLSVLVGVV